MSQSRINNSNLAALGPSGVHCTGVAKDGFTLFSMRGKPVLTTAQLEEERRNKPLRPYADHATRRSGGLGIAQSIYD